MKEKEFVDKCVVVVLAYICGFVACICGLFSLLSVLF